MLFMLPSLLSQGVAQIPRSRHTANAGDRGSRGLQIPLARSARWLVALAAAAISIPAWAGVEVHGGGACFDDRDVATELRGILAAYLSGGLEEDLSVIVFAERRDGRTAVQLRVERAGEQVLARHYYLDTIDCPSASRLLATVLESFLVELAVVPIAAEAPAPEAQAPPSAPWLVDFQIKPGTTLELAPPGGSSSLGLALRVGSGDLWGVGTLQTRVSYPKELGTGRFFAVASTVGVGVGLPVGNWECELELRGGAIHVLGFGYGQSFGQWLPWLEVAVTAWTHIGGLPIGAEIAVGPLRHEVFTYERRQTTHLSHLRVGVVAALPLWDGKF